MGRERKMHISQKILFQVVAFVFVATLPACAKLAPTSHARPESSAVPSSTAPDASTAVARSGLRPSRPSQSSFLKRAVFAGGQLWTLSDSGDLSRIREQESTRVAEDLAEPVVDLCVGGQSRQPEVVTCDDLEACSRWVLRRRVEQRWVSHAIIPVKKDILQGLDCRAEGTTLVTNRRIIDVGSRGQSETVLSKALPGGLVAAVLVTADQVFVGMNAGEFGGGLRRIDRRTGEVVPVERNATGSLCGGPLNPACDPITGLAVIPWKPTCVAATVGLVHFFPRGRIVEICGRAIEPLYEKGLKWRRWNGTAWEAYAAQKPPTDAGAPIDTEPFFGLASTATSLVAAGGDGIYRIEDGGTVRTTPFPEWKTFDGVYASFELPDFVLVLTQLNRRASISGSAPLIAPR
jgi:hypothetical protein